MKFEEGLLFLPRVLLSRKIRGGTRLTKFIADRFANFRSYRVAVPGGSLFVDLRSTTGQGYINKVALSEEHEVVKRCLRAGDVCYDIGANVGLYTVWMSGLIGTEGKVLAFEPNPSHRGGLMKTAETLGNTQVCALGLSDHQGSFDLFVPEDDTMASLADWTENEGGSVRRETCFVTTIDKLIDEDKAPRPDFIKCDIEGGEFDCFRGAARTLDSVDAPIILFEANINSTRGFGNNISSGMNFLAGLQNPRYRFFRVSDGGSLEPIVSIDFLHANILAIPESKSERIAGRDA